MFLVLLLCFLFYLIINFKGSPSKPKGPLVVNDITAEGCHLSWQKPEDDGGEPVDHYLIERMDLETGRWVPVATAKGTEADVREIFSFILYRILIIKYLMKHYK